MKLARNFGVHVTSGDFRLAFDGRAMTAGSARMILFTRNALRDSICISPMGLINRHGCAS